MVRSGDWGGAREVFEFVKANHATYGVKTMCRVLGVTASGYYAWRHRPPSARQRDDALLTDELRRFHRLSHERYGRPKLCMALAEAGYRVSGKRVARLMRAAGLYGVSRRRWPRACQYFCVRGIRLSRVGKAFAEGNGELVHGLSPFQH